MIKQRPSYLHARTFLGAQVAAARLARIVCAAAAATAAPATKPLPSKADIAGLFDKWNAALATLDSAKVADMYAKDAVLLPTVSNKVRLRQMMNGPAWSLACVSWPLWGQTA